MQKLRGRLHGLFWEVISYYDASVDIRWESELRMQSQEWSRP